MRNIVALTHRAAPLLLLAFLESCTGDGSTLGPDGLPLGPPVIVVTPREFDLSMIEETQDALRVGIANEGGLPLQVHDVSSSSPFLVPVFDGPFEVRGAEAAEIVAVITAPLAEQSPLEATIEVRSNDLRTPLVVIPLRLLATEGPAPEIGVSADSLTVRVAPEGSDFATLRIGNTGTADLEVESVLPTVSFLSVGAGLFTVAPGESVDVVITADASGLVAGAHLGAVEITSDDEDEGLLSVPVLLSVEAPFPAMFSTLRDSVFTPACATAGCHDLSGAGVELPLVGDGAYGVLVDVWSRERPTVKRVDPFKPHESYIVWKLEADPRIAGMPMPPFGRLDPEVIDVVRRWIEEGAPFN